MAKRNVILITIDSLRRDFLGCYGYAENISPVIDGLAEKGVRFENVWANSGNTPNAFKSIMTGKYPLQEPGYGVFEKQDYLPYIFKKEGYRTIGIVAGNPLVSRYYGYGKGFDIFFDFMDKRESAIETKNSLSKITTALRHACKWISYQIGTSFYVFFISRLYELVRKGYGYDVWPHRFSYKKVISQLESTLNSNNWANGRDKIFMWLHFMDVHHPYGRPEGMPESICQCLHDLINFQDRANRVPKKRINVAITAKIRRMYEQSIRDMDCGLKELLSVLSRYRLLEDSSVFILSDHGDLLGEHGLLGHRRLLFNELLKIPAIVYEDESSGSDKVYREPVSQRDIYKLILLSKDRAVSKLIREPISYNEEIFSEMYCDEYGGMFMDGHKYFINLFKLDETARRLYSLVKGDKKLTYQQYNNQYIFSDLFDNVLDISQNGKLVYQDMFKILHQHIHKEQADRKIAKQRHLLRATVKKVVDNLKMNSKGKEQDMAGESKFASR